MLEPDGDYSVYVGSSAIGQGLETAFSQIAADALEVPISRLRGIFHGTTSYVNDGYGAYHSRSVVMGGSAMLDAVKNLNDAIRATAAKRLGCEPSQVEIVEGTKAVGPGRQVHRARGAHQRRHLRPKAPFSTRSTPTPTAPTPRMWRSIPSSATCN